MRKRRLLTTEDCAVAHEAIDMSKAHEAGSLPDPEKAMELYRRAEALAERCKTLYHDVLFERDLSELAMWPDQVSAALEAQCQERSPGVDRETTQALKSFVRDVEHVLAHRKDPLAPLWTLSLVSRLPENLWARARDDGTESVEGGVGSEIMARGTGC